MHFVSLTVAAFTLIPLGAASSQTVQPRNGDRIRITTAENALNNRIAHVLSIRSDSLLLLVAPAETLAVARAGVTRLEVNTGRRNYPLRGAGIGVLIGLVGGALTGLADGSDHYGKAGDKALVLGVEMAIPGVVIGTIVGASLVYDRWTSVPLGVARATPRLHVSRAGARLSVGISFQP